MEELALVGPLVTVEHELVGEVLVVGALSSRVLDLAAVGRSHRLRQENSGSHGFDKSTLKLLHSIKFV